MGNTYPRISTRVSKLGASIATVNLPPGITCRGAPCERQCYAKKGTFMYPVTRNCLLKNYEAYRENPERYFKVVDGYLTMVPYRFFRWHSSGDIVDERYLDLMCKLARKHKGTKFLCFSKKFELINKYLGDHRKPKNLMLVLSVWGDWIPENPHNLPMAYVRLDASTKIPETAMKCRGYCGDCIQEKKNCWSLKDGESVWFKKH